MQPYLIQKRQFSQDSNAIGIGEVFQQLRQLSFPGDGQQLAKLAAAAADSARHGALTSKQAALLAYRLDGAGWFSREVCEALGKGAQRYVEDLTAAEWLVILRYFASTGYTQKEFSAAAARWLSGSETDISGSGQLQLPQLQELAAILAHTGDLNGPAADAVIRALSHLPPEVDTGILVKLTACLAASNAGQPTFYQNVVASVSKLKTGSTSWAPVVEELDSSDFWRLSVLFLLAKADITRWPLVLNILRKLDPRVASMGLPATWQDKDGLNNKVQVSGFHPQNSHLVASLMGPWAYIWLDFCHTISQVQQLVLGVWECLQPKQSLRRTVALPSHFLYASLQSERGVFS